MELSLMSLFFRQGNPETSYEVWRDVFDPYLRGLYETMKRLLSSSGILRGCRQISYETFCSFVYQYSSKYVPDVFFKELDERLLFENEDIQKETLHMETQLP